MASIGSDPNGHRRILFVAGDGSRKTIRLGKCSQRQSEAARVRVEALIAAAIVGQTPDDETSRWVAGLPDEMHRRIARAGLVLSRERSAMGLGAFLKAYFDALAVKRGTATAYGHTRRYLLGFFGEARALRSIEPADADKWRQHLKAAGLSESTIARRVISARQMFKTALKWKLIADNPFADVKGGNQTNRSRMFFVGPDAAGKVLDACPDAEWRLLFALSRYGGLRCPSEHLALRWGDVDWERGRIRVPSPKTEHHAGKESRWIPLFPELRPYLQEAFDLAEPGSEFVITRCRDSAVNLRTHLFRIIRKAGMEPWPKLFQNLRASRETELAESFPIHVVCQWIGNSRAVAQDHYLQVTDSHFERAAQNPAQQAPELSGNDKKLPTSMNAKHSDLPSISEQCGMVHIGPLGAVGFEPTKA
jgi:integrase